MSTPRSGVCWEVWSQMLGVSEPQSCSWEGPQAGRGSVWSLEPGQHGHRSRWRIPSPSREDGLWKPQLIRRRPTILIGDRV